MKDKKEKTRYQQIIDGEVEPVGEEKGWRNLEQRTSFNMMDEERQREISRKGGIAVQKLHGERKTARESLEKILTLRITDEILDGAEISTELAERFKRDNPNATIYDLIQMVAVGKAVGGNLKAYELIRDTHGDKPKDTIAIEQDIMTETDRAMLKKITARIDNGEKLTIVKDVTDGE